MFHPVHRLKEGGDANEPEKAAQANQTLPPGDETKPTEEAQAADLEELRRYGGFEVRHASHMEMFFRVELLTFHRPDAPTARDKRK
jgi:hypothetical protein